MNLDIYLKFKRIDHGGCNHNVHNASKMCKPSLTIIIYTDLSNNSDDILGDWTLLQSCAGGPHPNYSRFYIYEMHIINISFTTRKVVACQKQVYHSPRFQVKII